MTLKSLIALAAGLMIWAAPAYATSQHALPSGGTLTTAPNDEVMTERECLDGISYQSQGAVDPTLAAFWPRGEQSVYVNHADWLREDGRPGRA